MGTTLELLIALIIASMGASAVVAGQAIAVRLKVAHQKGSIGPHYRYHCANCGHEIASQVGGCLDGQCPECGMWISSYEYIKIARHRGINNLASARVANCVVAVLALLLSSYSFHSIVADWSSWLGAVVIVGVLVVINQIMIAFCGVFCNNSASHIVLLGLSMLSAFVSWGILTPWLLTATNELTPYWEAGIGSIISCAINGFACILAVFVRLVGGSSK